MSSEWDNKIIPVIGVPLEARKLPSARIPKKPKETDGNSTETVVNSTEKPEERKEKPPKPPKQKQKQKQNLNNKFLKNLITDTGKPASMNGLFVAEEEAKLTLLEKKAMKIHIEENTLSDPQFPTYTTKHQGRIKFKCRLLWLLNKETFMKRANKPHLANIVVKQAHMEAVPPKQNVNQKKQMKNQEKNKNAKPLMDIKFDEKARSFKQRTGEDYNGGFDISSNYQGSEGSGGYQHIGNTWPNTESQWNYDPSTNGYSTFLASTPDTSTTYQPYQPSEYANFSRQLESSSSSVPVYGGATDPTQTSTSSVISFGVAVHEPISESSASAYDDPTRNHWNPQSATSDYSTVPTSGTSNVFPSYQTSEYSSFPNQTPSSSSSYQQSSQYTPMVPDLINQAINGYTTPQYNQPNQQVNQDFNTNQFSASLASLHSQPLEASEDELLRQKRLMEIEQELHMINAKKMHMQMEAEIRHREMELAKRQQLMELRERELRDRECFENGRTHAGHTGFKPRPIEAIG
ncbi:uncharacterized protein CELE_F08F8.9 [Caenorhabditis elegans]|uniref:Uncharacterized protein n=1 Tax=Caenorhabditis elegans TaxID=6239 RepID=H2KZP3_CAEEL|nr:Uncharacterized protein CELE_F08F8.9 [Caenorhabditis elegans]CCD69068.1 Uncharacterized protein CELE_F08F8.9 [Caenorhabditis elegans]|eukprot:NP_741226.1 Uncharacterized protein CELE_F08F8.9 [Caenorhabditis elegans]